MDVAPSTADRARKFRHLLREQIGSSGMISRQPSRHMAHSLSEQRQRYKNLKSYYVNHLFHTSRFLFENVNCRL
jgi:hypothetical protein